MNPWPWDLFDHDRDLKNSTLMEGGGAQDTGWWWCTTIPSFVTKGWVVHRYCLDKIQSHKHSDCNITPLNLVISKKTLSLQLSPAPLRRKLDMEMEETVSNELPLARGQGTYVRFLLKVSALLRSRELTRPNSCMTRSSWRRSSWPFSRNWYSFPSLPARHEKRCENKHTMMD